MWRAPQCCGTGMRGVIVDPLPRGLRLWACDRCMRRQWFFYGEPVSAADAARIAEESDAAHAGADLSLDLPVD